MILAIVAVSAIAILSRDDPAPAGGGLDDDSGDDVVYGPYGQLIEGNPTIMDIGSTSCIPCQQLQPVLTSLGQKYDGEINFRFYDCWNTAEGADMASAYQLSVIPTLIFLDGNGHEVARLMGYNSQETIEAKMSELGWI
ncbi:MAG: thioredoxin family protein [Chromatiales bacterium]|nr:thioredoxin family protein [Chromatiales bacterium]